MSERKEISVLARPDDMLRRRTEQSRFMAGAWSPDRLDIFAKALGKSNIPGARESAEFYKNIQRKMVEDAFSVLDQEAAQDNLGSASILTRAVHTISDVGSNLTFLTPEEIRIISGREQELGYLYLDTVTGSLQRLYETLPSQRDYEQNKGGYYYENVAQDSIRRIRTARRLSALHSLRYGAPNNHSLRPPFQIIMRVGSRDLQHRSSPTRGTPDLLP